MENLRRKVITPVMSGLKSVFFEGSRMLSSLVPRRYIPVGGVLGASFSVIALAYQGNFSGNPFSVLKVAQQTSPVVTEPLDVQASGIAMEVASPARVMAPQGAFPLERGMAIVSRLSNPNAGAPGQGSLRDGYVLGVFDIRNPQDNSASVAPAVWSAPSSTTFRHPEWTNAVMGEVFGVEIDNSVTNNPQVFVGSTGTFVGNINGASQYAGRTIPAIGSKGGDVFRIDGSTGGVSVLNNSIPSVGYNTEGGRGATDIEIPINTTNGGILKSYAIVNGGSGYSNGLYLLNVSGSEGGASGTVWVTVTNGSITALTPGLAGTGYQGDITIDVVPGGGSGFTYDITLGYPLQTGTYTPAEGGAGYPLFPAYAIMGDGTGAVATVTTASGNIMGYNLTFAGSNYSRNATLTVNNRYTGVGNIGYNYARKVVYTSSIDNGMIYAMDAVTGAFLGSPYDHLPTVADPVNLAVSDIRRLPIGISWNPRDNRLYFSRVSDDGYTVAGNIYNFTHNEVISIGLNADGSINTTDTPREEIRVPVARVTGDQRSLITDIEFTSDGNIALLGEMSTGEPGFRSIVSEFRFTKGSHNAIAREYRFESGEWNTTPVQYKVGNTYGGYNNTGGVDFGYGNSENPDVYYDAAVLTGDYIEGSGYVYGIQISPLSQGNFPVNDEYNHYIVDDNQPVLGLFLEKTGIGDVDVFSGVDFPLEEVELTILSQNDATDCNTGDGIIVLSGTGLLPNTPYPVSYVKDGGSPVAVTVISDINGNISLTDLSPGEYTDIQISDPPNITSNTLTTRINCPLPELSLGTVDYPSTCTSTDGVIRLTGAEPGTSYRIEYVKDGGTPVFVTLTSDAGGILELTGLTAGSYTQIRINDDVTGQVGSSLTADLTCLPELSLGTVDYPSTCTSTDGVIRLTGAEPGTSYRIEYVKDGGTPVFVTLTSDAGGILELTGLTAGSYTQIRINDDVTGQVGFSLTADLTCLPELSLGTVDYPSTCTSTDGVIRLTGAEPGTSYRIEYVKDGGTPVFVTLTSDAGGILELTGLTAGSYTQIRINDDVTGQVGSSLTADLTCLPELSLGTIDDPSTCTSTDGVIRLTGAEPGTSYRIEYVKDGGTPVFVTLTSDAGGILELTGLTAGSYTQIRINDDVTGQIGTSLTADLTCLPELSLGTIDDPSTCTSTDGIIRLTGAEPGTSYRIEYVKDGGTPVFVTLTSDAGGILELTGLTAGNYTQIRINDDVTGQVGNSLTADLTCLPELSLGTIDDPSTCTSTDGVIRLTGAEPGTSYRIEYVKDGGTPVFVTLTSDAGGILELTGLTAGNYTQIRINDDVTGQVGTSLTADLTCLPELSLGTVDYPSTCTSTDGVIRLTGAEPGTSYRIEYVKDGGTPVFVTLTSDAGGILELTGLTAGSYTQIRINDDITGQVGNSLNATLECTLPVIAAGTHTLASTCTSTDGVIRITGLELSTTYRIEYVKNGGTSAFVNLVSDASGIAEITGLERGIYSTIRINDEATGSLSNSLSVTLLAENDIECAPLPVTLISFTVREEQGSANLTWTTVSEMNSDHFEVQYSQDGKNWNNIGRLDAAGESVNVVSYSFKHGNIAIGNNYYKLKMADIDGSYTFSHIQSVVYDGRAEVVISPNPAAEQILIKSNNWSHVISVKMVDMTGRQIYKSGNQPVSVIDSRNLKSGVYLLIIENKNGTSSTHRVIVNH